MRVSAWPEEAQREWLTHFVQTLQLGLNARGETYLKTRDVKEVVALLMERQIFNFDWPTRYVNDVEICRLRFMEGLSGIELHERVKADGKDTEHKRITEIDRAWTATFQTAIQALRAQRDHPLRRPVYQCLKTVNVGLALKLIPVRSRA